VRRLSAVSGVDTGMPAQLPHPRTRSQATVEFAQCPVSSQNHNVCGTGGKKTLRLTAFGCAHNRADRLTAATWHTPAVCKQHLLLLLTHACQAAATAQPSRLPIDARMCMCAARARETHVASIALPCLSTHDKLGILKVSTNGPLLHFRAAALYAAPCRGIS
jgi:hypothetical protein